MYNILFRHSWLQFTRSATLSRNVATLIFLGFIGLLFGGYFLLLAFFLDKILQEFSTEKNTFDFLCSLLVYHFLAEALFRYFMQSLPVLNIQPYLHLPFNRKKLVNYLIIRSYLHPFNLLTAILLLPYTLQVLVPYLGTAAAWQWWGVMVLLSWLINGLMFFFKKHLDDHPAGTILLFILIALSAGSQYIGLFNLGELVAPFFRQAAELSWLPAVMAGLIFAVYVLNFRFLLANIYPEEWAGKKEQARALPALGLLRSLGTVGELMGLEWRLILRHKRSRSILYMSAFFLLYGLLFYTNPVYRDEKQGFLLFTGILITGIFMMNYGQLMYSWNSSHYDFYLSKPLGLPLYLKSKYYLLAGISVLGFLLSIPYVYFGWDVVLVNVCMLFFNLGVNAFVVLNMAMWAPKKIDLQKGSVMNYEGMGAAQWMMALPVLLTPYLFYAPLSIAGYPQAGVLLVGGIGLTGIIMHKYLLQITARRLAKRKYRIAHTFRNE